MDIMIDIEFFREQKQRGITPLWHCEPSVEPPEPALACFTIVQRVEQLLLNVEEAGDSLSSSGHAQSFLDVFFRTEEVQ